MLQVKGQPPPAPCRGVKKQGKSADGGGDEEEDEGQDGGMDFDDMLPRTDIRLAVNHCMCNAKSSFYALHAGFAICR